MTTLAVVVPCYNEEEVLPETIGRMTELLDSMAQDGLVSESSFISFVDDGSRDKTWQLISEAAERNPRVKGLRLSRNRGHQNALLAGLLNSEGDILVSVDADLQDDIGVIRTMVEQHAAGSDIVYGVRSKRATDTWFKRFTAESYYHILEHMGVDIVFNHADFRLMSRRAIEALRMYGETNLFLRGVIPTVGFKTSTVEYERHERFAGESKYPVRKMLALAADGITSFSVVPLRAISALGLVVFVGSMVLSGWVLWTKLVSGAAIPGWASSVLPMYFLGGIQLLSIGVLGEYVAKTYLETKRRPRFFISEQAGNETVGSVVPRDMTDLKSVG